MNLVDIILLAFALSIDACVVSFSYGTKIKNSVVKSSLLLALFTGVFQSLMPYLGGICTNCVRCYIEPFSKWIVFAIFLYLGFNFIKEGINKSDNEAVITEKNTNDVITYPTLFMVAAATSIDAFSAGITLCLNLDCIIFPIILIGLVTFVNSIIGFFTGKFFSRLNPKILEIIGGLILITLAIKVII